MSSAIQSVLIIFFFLGQLSPTLTSSYVLKPMMSQQVPSSSELNLRGYVEDSMNDWVRSLGVYRGTRQKHFPSGLDSPILGLPLGTYFTLYTIYMLRLEKWKPPLARLMFGFPVTLNH